MQQGCERWESYAIALADPGAKLILVVWSRFLALHQTRELASVAQLG